MSYACAIRRLRGGVDLPMSVKRTEPVADVPGGVHHAEGEALVSVPGLSDEERACAARLLSVQHRDGEASIPAQRETAPDGAAYEYAIVGDVACLVSCAVDPQEGGSCDLAVPDRLGGAPVAIVGALAFSKLDRVASISLPDTVVDVGRRAFDGCRSLERLRFSARGVGFNRSWVRGCARLADLTLPGALERLEDSDFDLPSLRSLSIGAGLRFVDPQAFSRLRLERIDVDAANPFLATDGAGVYTKGFRDFLALAVPQERYALRPTCAAIGGKAFAYHGELRQVELNEGLVSIGKFAFFESGLVSCELPSTVTHIRAKAFGQCARLSSVRLNEGLVSIGAEAFARSPLTALELPRTLRAFGRDAFAQTKLSVAGEAPALSVAPGNEHIVFDGAGGLYEREEDGSLTLKAVLGAPEDLRVLPGTVSVAPGACQRNEALRSLSVAEGVRSIGEGAFEGCSKLESIDLPSTLESLGANALRDTAVTRIAIPSALRHIGTLALRTSDAFGGNPAATLHDVTIDPENACFSLQEGLLCERVAEGEHVALIAPSPPEDLSVPRSVVAFGPYCFAGVSGVRTLRVHAHVRTIEYGAFSFREPPSLIVLELARPVLGRREVACRLPASNDQARAALPRAVSGMRLDPEVLCDVCDGIVQSCGTLWDRARSAVERLSAPIYLTDEARDRYERMLSDQFDKMCREIAAHNASHLFDAMADIGAIDAASISRAIDVLGEAGHTRAVGHLLEMKRRRFGGARDDWEL